MLLTNAWVATLDDAGNELPQGWVLVEDGLIEAALGLGTRGGAAVLRRDDIGAIEPGRCADLAVWRLDGLEHGGADDPVASLVFAGPQRVDRLYVGGEEVVRDGHLVNADEEAIAEEHRRQARRFLA